MTRPSRTRATVALLFLATAGCAPRRTSDATAAGCCCAYYNCRPAYTQSECVANAQFQGWTYTWHEGPCTSADRHPAPDSPSRD